MTTDTVSAQAMDQISPVVKAGGSALDAAVLDELVDLRVDWQLRLPARCVLRFDDVGYALSGGSTFALGTAITVSLYSGTTLFDGEVTGFGIEQESPDSVPQLTVVAHDKAHRLGRGTVVKTYAQQKYSDILSTIAGDASLSVSGTTSLQLDYVIQADSNLALLNTMADRAAYDWWVDAGTLHFEAPSAGSSVTLSLTSDLLSFAARGSGMHADSVVVRGWDRKAKQAVVATSQDVSAAAQLPSASFLSGFASAGSKFGGDKTLTTGGIMPFDSTEATTIAGSVRDTLAYGATEARGSCYARGDIKPGGTVHVTGPTHLTGDYRVTRVEHVFRRTGFETRFYAGSRRPTSLVDTLGPAAGNGHGGSFRMPALVVGQVTKNKDSNNQAPTGWVEVKYGWLGDQVVSAWARIATVGGGATRGIVFMPEVDDEVLIGFENGDPMRPVVIGALFGTTDTPPTFTIGDDGTVETRRIVSRLGHAVEMSDGTEDAKKYVIVQLSDNATKLRLGLDKSSLEIPSGKELTIKVGDNHIVFGTDNSIEIKAQSIKLTATQNIDIASSGGNVTAKSSGGNIDLEGLQATLKGTTSGTVDGGVSLTLKGATGVAIN